MLAELLTSGLFVFLILFVRVGTAIMVLPGFGETYVSPTIRLGLALAVTLALAPIVGTAVPSQPPDPMPMILLLGGEVVVGLLIGGIARIIMSALHVAGTVIAFNSGLAYALTIDPSQGTQGALVASLLGFMGVVIIFATNLHFMLLGAIADSYQLFPPGALPPVGDFANLATRVISGSFRLGVQLSAPFIVFAIVVNVGMGVLARLMPALPIFFVIVPLQIWFAFLLLGVTLGGILQFHTSFFEERISELLVAR